MRIKIVGLVLAILVMTPAMAADWKPMPGKEQSGATIFVDVTSIVRAGGIVTAWIKYDYSTATTPSPTTPGKILGHMDFRCSTKELRTTFEMTYDVKGNIIRSGAPASAAFEPFIPESVGEALGNRLCALYAKPATNPPR